MIDFIKRINIWIFLSGLAVVVGAALRLYGLSGTGIFFYDEALYLSHALPVLELIERVRPAGVHFWEAIGGYLKVPLAFTKPVWILIIDSRYFFTHVHDWDYAKYAASLFGILTLPLTFMFAWRFSGVWRTAFLSILILALLPGHVFYSRLGLQESFSVFVVLLGFYCYLFPRDFGKKTFWAGFLLGMAYLANYRLIVLPVLLVATELWFGVICREGMRWRHLVWACMTFLAVMVVVGSLMGGTQMYFSFAWIFHQQHMAVAKRMWSEVFAYPYYLFRLENLLVAGSFFGGVWFIFRREWKMAWPLVVCCVQMLLFTTATDRGARYIAVMLPFIAVGAAVFMEKVFRDIPRAWRMGLVVVMGIMCVGMAVKSMRLISASSDYRTSAEYLVAQDATVKFLSTQDIVQKLYLKDREHVRAAPGDVAQLLLYYTQGYRYLVLDPQAYISFPGNDYKWGIPLKGYLSFVDKNMRPMKEFPHFNQAVMERVVFEHSDNLFQSIRFLDSRDIARMSSLRIYDLRVLVPVLSNIIKSQENK